MSILVIGNQKGGVGKSTLTALFAHWLAEKRNASVCVVDLDSQCNCSKSLLKFGAGAGSEAASLFDAGAIEASEAKEWRFFAAPGITLFRGSRHLVDLELVRADCVIPVFCRHVVALGKLFDFVLIDTPPALGLRMSAALIAADHVVCPIELEEYSIDGVTDMLKTIFGVRKRYNPKLRLAGILANRFNPHSVRQKAAFRELVASYSEFVLPVRISTRSAIPEALAAGIPVWQLPKSAAREASSEVFQAFELIFQRMRVEECVVREEVVS